MTRRDYHREVIEATMADDLSGLATLASELAGIVGRYEERLMHEAERRERYQQKRRRARAKTCRNVSAQAETGDLSPPGPPSPSSPETPSPSSPFTPPSPNGVAIAPLARFPKPVCDALYNRWLAKRGAVNYGTLRKAFDSLFPATGPLFSLDELLAAIDAYGEAASASPPEFADRWTPKKLADDARRWVRLGKMPVMDEWGEPTERGRAAKVGI